MIKVLGLDPVRITHEHVGAPAGATQRPLGDSHVVAHEIDLRQAEIRIDDSIRV